MIAKVPRHRTQSPRRPQRHVSTLRGPRALRTLRSVVAIAVVLCGSSSPDAHDFERTQVTLTFARDGAFVLDVANDAAWLEHRLIPFRTAATAAPSSFADRVVLFVDGH